MCDVRLCLRMYISMDSTYKTVSTHYMQYLRSLQETNIGINPFYGYGRRSNLTIHSDKLIKLVIRVSFPSLLTIKKSFDLYKIPVK